MIDGPIKEYAQVGVIRWSATPYEEWDGYKYYRLHVPTGKKEEVWLYTDSMYNFLCLLDKWNGMSNDWKYWSA